MTTLLRARSCFEIKSISEPVNGKRRFKGTATTPSTDRMGDIVEPLGAKFVLPLSFLWQHDSMDPVGWIDKTTPTRNGIDVEGEVADIEEPGALKDRLTMAWQMMKAKLVRGLSIGFRPLEYEPINAKDPFGPVRFKVWEWLELSAVTIAANQDASIHAIKSIDDRLLAASGRAQKAVTVPRVGGNISTNTKPPNERNTMKTLQEKIAEREELRTQKAARLKELGELKETEQRKFTTDEKDELKTLADDIDEIDDDLRVLRGQVEMSHRAKPVSETEGGRRSAGGYVFRKGADQEEKFKGQNYVRQVIAKALALVSQNQGNYLRPSQIAEARWGKTNPTLVAIMKANEVPGGGTGSGEWGHELVQADTRYTGDFINFLYSETVFDKLPLREIPANVPVKGQDGAATGYWVGESKAIPATTGDFSSTNLTPLKVAALAVVSNELLADSSPAAEGLVGDALKEASTQRVDTTFLSATAASAGVSPAGILNGLSAIPSNGGDAQSIMTDLKALVATFITAKNVRNLYIVTTPTLASALGLMRNALGQPEFPGITVNGGTFMGYPVVVGDNVPSGDVIMLNPREIWKIGDSGISISVSRDAMIEQSTAPTGETDTPTAASQAFTSMFQEESTAIKVVRRINFQKRRTSAVAYVSGADYGSELSA